MCPSCNVIKFLGSLSAFQMIAFLHCGRPRSVWREEAAAETETQRELQHGTQLPKDFFLKCYTKRLKENVKTDWLHLGIRCTNLKRWLARGLTATRSQTNTSLNLLTQTLLHLFSISYFLAKKHSCTKTAPHKQLRPWKMDSDSLSFSNKSPEQLSRQTLSSIQLKSRCIHRLQMCPLMHISGIHINADICLLPNSQCLLFWDRH